MYRTGKGGAPQLKLKIRLPSHWQFLSEKIIGKKERKRKGKKRKEEERKPKALRNTIRNHGLEGTKIQTFLT